MSDQKAPHARTGSRALHFGRVAGIQSGYSVLRSFWPFDALVVNDFVSPSENRGREVVAASDNGSLLPALLLTTGSYKPDIL